MGSRERATDWMVQIGGGLNLGVVQGNADWGTEDGGDTDYGIMGDIRITE